MEYNEDKTYLIFDKRFNFPLRMAKSNNLFYGNKNEVDNELLKDKLSDLIYEIKLVKDCSEELQKEYRKLIDKEL